MLPYHMRGILFSAPCPRKGNMTTTYRPQDKYLEVAQVFHWASKDHYNLWFNGNTNRCHRTEVLLPRLSKNRSHPTKKKRSLVSLSYGKQMVYACPRRWRNEETLLKVPHGLGCTECIVRFYRSNLQTEIIAERKFVGCGTVPDFGVKFPNGKMILVEYTTKTEFSMKARIKNKLYKYQINLGKIEWNFDTKAMIIFVIDQPRENIERFVKKMIPIDLPVYFVDLESFKKVSIGEQLKAPIYIWGKDGESHPLTNA